MNDDIDDKLTRRQREVLTTIAELTRKIGAPPTFRELGDALGIASSNGVEDHIRMLQRKGYLHPVKPREVRARMASRLTDKAAAMLDDAGRFHAALLRQRALWAELPEDSRLRVQAMRDIDDTLAGRESVDEVTTAAEAVNELT